MNSHTDDEPARQQTVIVIAGPTAVGKTAVAVALARHLQTAIVSADSRQCYREMTIGTAKPAPEELAAVRHYFMDEFPVDTHITAADYERLALGYLEDIFKTTNTAVVCGGTGLYIKALCEGLDAMPDVNDSIAQEVNSLYITHGIAWLQQAVKTEDPIFYETAEVTNPARLLRALIFRRSTGQSIVDYRTAIRQQRPFRIIKIGLELPREVLYDRINNRVYQMMQAGLAEEVQALYSLRHLKNLHTVGYAELFDYIEGKYGRADAVEKIQQHTRNYAKRQFTWFKKDPDMIWMDARDTDLTERIIAISK